ncbi:MAG TPA: restriction endonuclease subunit S [Desulfobacterales bacterium]|nr:restriction endonuclease subunit S [Desulfobacterales bacterium]
MQQQSELPEGWELVILKDILEINPSKPHKDVVPPNTPVTFVPMPAVDADSGAITNPEIRDFSKVRKGYTAFQNEDVIFAKITPCMENGKAAIARNLKNNYGFGSTEFFVFRSKGAILPDYLYSHIRQESYRNSAESNMTGSVGQKRVPKDFVQNSSIPLPPLSEQHRIISAIEALFARLDAANERLDRVPEILKRFRQSVLAAACDGGLTEEWREKNRIKKDSWSDLEFFDFIVLKRGYDLPLSKRIEGPYPIMTSAGIAAYHDEYKMSGPGVVVGRSGSTGRVHYIDKDYWPHNTTLFVSDFKRNFTRFVYLFLINFDLKKYGASTAVPTLNRNNLRGIVVSIPPLSEQHEIVRRVDALFALADSIEAKVAAAREKTNKLRQSILAKAFSGELVETEAELARREGRDYEPADVLIERIKAERGKSGKKGN